MGSFSVWHWLVVLAIVMLVFGTKKLGNIGSDLGMAVKGFKDGVRRESEATARPGIASQVVDNATTDTAAKEKEQSVA